MIIDGLVSAQIVKHCRDNLPELVTGQLLGLGTGGLVRGSMGVRGRQEVEGSRTRRKTRRTQNRE